MCSKTVKVVVPCGLFHIPICHTAASEVSQRYCFASAVVLERNLKSRYCALFFRFVAENTLLKQYAPAWDMRHCEGGVAPVSKDFPSLE